MTTQAMPLAEMAAADSGLAAYRIATPGEMATLLRRLQDANAQLNLNAPRGGVYTTTLWAADAARGVLSFAADTRDPRVQTLAEGDEATVVGYLDNVKVQFDVHNLLLVHRGQASALNASYPGEMFRFQRRGSFRVRPILRDAPEARLRHPMIPDMPLALRLLDVSVNGCALLLPEDVPPFEPGVQINRVQVELGLDTRFDCTLRVQHITTIQPGSHGVRLGCEMMNLGQDAARTLQRYIDQTQKRRRFLALE